MFLIIFILNQSTIANIFPLSLHDALPISCGAHASEGAGRGAENRRSRGGAGADDAPTRHRARGRGDDDLRSEEHTSELQSRGHLVCRLLLEKKNFNYFYKLDDFQICTSSE